MSNTNFLGFVDPPSKKNFLEGNYKDLNVITFWHFTLHFELQKLKNVFWGTSSAKFFNPGENNHIKHTEDANINMVNIYLGMRTYLSYLI